jgi:hypothetical protein
MSVLLPIIITLFNTLVALWIIERNINSDTKRFNKTVFSSLVVRFFLVLIVFALVYYYVEIDTFIFPLIFLISQFLCIIIEIIYINIRFKQRFNN